MLYPEILFEVFHHRTAAVYTTLFFNTTQCIMCMYRCAHTTICYVECIIIGSSDIMSRCRHGSV